MLVLSRRIDERLVLDLGDGRLVWLTVVDVRRRASYEGSEARLGIDAPESVKIWRKELWGDVSAEGRETSRGIA